MRLSVLASGSKGNAIFIEMDGTRLLLDVGIGLRRLKEGLTALGVPLDTLDGVLLTHEHRDHVVGLSALLKEVSLPVYSRPGTIAALPRRDLLPAACLHPFRGDMVIGGVKVEPFPLSHDAAEPVGYRVRGSRTCTVATDLGFVTGAVQDAIEGAD
ncbi:MAG: MBL fold metallo-hydrolase, partial [Schwartzia sp. (in: firmicutes)]